MMTAAVANLRLRAGSHLRYIYEVTAKNVFQEAHESRLKGCRGLTSGNPVAKRRPSRGWRYAVAGFTGAVAGDWLHNYTRFSFKPTGSRIPPKIDPTRQVKFQSDTSGLKLTLYQYQSCPFSSKVRTFLNFRGISYDIVEVDPVDRHQIKFSYWKKLPILVVEEENGTFVQLNDSSMIISCLESYMMDKTRPISTLSRCYPYVAYRSQDGEKVAEVLNRYSLMYGEKPVVINKEEMQLEKKWRVWADNVLARTVPPNIYRTPEEAMEALQLFSEDGKRDKNIPAWHNYFVQYMGPPVLYLAGKRLKMRDGLKDDVRQSLYEATDDWIAALGQKPFLGGDEPNLADLAVYGVLNFIEGCASFRDLSDNTQIYKWYNRMKRAVKSQQFPTLNSSLS